MVVSGIHVAGAQLTGVRVDVSALTALAEFPDTTPRGIAGVIARLVNSGELAAGDPPAHRSRTRRALGVSPATVSQAWQALARAGLIESRGRAGSFVRGSSPGSARPADARDGGAERPRAPRPLARHPRPAAAAGARAGALARLGARRDRQLPGRAGDPGARRRARRLLAVRRRSRSWSSTARSTRSRARSTRSCASATASSSRAPGFPPFLDLLDLLGAEAVPVRARRARACVPDALAPRAAPATGRDAAAAARAEPHRRVDDRGARRGARPGHPLGVATSTTSS